MRLLLHITYSRTIIKGGQTCEKSAETNKVIRVYLKTNPEQHEAVLSGIRFVEFIECVPKIENIMLLKGGFLAKKNWQKFELVEGHDQLSQLMLEDVCNYGDFCFVDYANATSIEQIDDEQIAELLYLSHMFKPLKSPFFESLQNKYAYLAHDDGFYCKLYCKQQQLLVSIVVKKLERSVRVALGDNASPLPESLSEEIFKYSQEGILAELDLSTIKKGIIKKNDTAERLLLKLYTVGEYNDMDLLFNNFEKIRPQAFFEVDVGKVT